VRLARAACKVSSGWSPAKVRSLASAWHCAMVSPRRSTPTAAKTGKRRAGFEGCLKIVPGDGPSKVFLDWIARFCPAALSPDRDCVWSLVEK